MAENFPRRPGERESPWFDIREIWDQAVENRIKVLEDTVDEGPTDWGQVVRSDDVERLILTKDAEYPLEDGDLVLLENEETFYEDFSGFDVGQTISIGWDSQWGSVSREILLTNNFPGGRLLEITHTDTQAYSRYIPISLISGRRTVTDIEVTMCWSVPYGIYRAPRIVLNANGASEETGSMTEIYHVSNDSRGVRIRINGQIENTVIPVKDNFIFEEGRWYITRARQSGTKLMQKVWTLSEKEPEEWDFVFEDNPRYTDPGHYGVRCYGGSGMSAKLAFYGVAIGGGRAPVADWVV